MILLQRNSVLLGLLEGYLGISCIQQRVERRCLRKVVTITNQTFSRAILIDQVIQLIAEDTYIRLAAHSIVPQKTKKILKFFHRKERLQIFNFKKNKMEFSGLPATHLVDRQPSFLGSPCGWLPELVSFPGCPPSGSWSPTRQGDEYPWKRRSLPSRQSGSLRTQQPASLSLPSFYRML